MNKPDNEVRYHKISWKLCQHCVRAAAIRVERSSTHYRCGCDGGANCGKWSWQGETMTCSDFVEIVDNARKAKVNLAWELSADRKMWLGRPPMPDSHVVEIDRCGPHFNRPFKGIGA